MDTVLVTGGAGFLGSHLCENLISNGYKVVCLDNLITGREENLSSFVSSESFEFINQDVVEEITINLNIDYIFHLASPASPIDYLENPEATALTNSLGTYNILKLAKNNNARVLLASTSEVYGDPLEHPQKETYWGNVNSYGPRACYDESKRFAEALSFVYVNEYGVDVRIIRIFNTYGPRMRKNDGRVISNFINQALSQEDITVYGDGSQTRSFCYVDDLIRGMKKVMFTESITGEVFNLGNPGEYTILQLAEKILELVDTKSNIVYKPLPKDDPTKRKPDISKVIEYLDWKPDVNLEEGLRKTIDYYKSL